MQIPAAVIAFPLLAGCAAGVVSTDAGDPGLALRAAAACVIVLFAGAAWITDDLVPEGAAAVSAATLLAGFSLGLTAAREAYMPPLLEWYEAQPATTRDAPVLIEGVLREDATLTGFGASVVLDVVKVAGAVPIGGHARRPGGIRIAVGGGGVPASIAAWRAGRTVRAPAVLRPPATYRNPGLPDERRALARRGIVLVGSVKSAALVEVVGEGSPVEEAAAAARAWVRATLDRYVGSRGARSGAVVTAILIGDRTALDEDDVRRLQEAGTYHVIAISGGNIAILTVILLGACRAARLPPRAAAAVTISALLFYAQLTGAPASVTRAVTAAVLYLAGRIVDHRGPPLNALAVAAVGALAVSPLGALDAGFILSFGATVGILLGVPALAASRGAMVSVHNRDSPGLAAALHLYARRAALGAAALFAATLCAELALAPAGAALFSRVTVAGLVLNFAAIPLMTVAQLAGMATLCLAPATTAGAKGAGIVAHASATGLVESSRVVEWFPWMAFDAVPPAWWLLGVYYAGCAALWSRHPRAASAVIGLSLVLMLSGCPAFARDMWPPPKGRLRVVFLDVGQGDATLITLPDGRSLLVDAGGLPGTAFDIGERVLVPSLRALGVRRLEELIVTHGDPDHIGGALTAARRFSARTIREGVPVPPHEGLRALADHAFNSGAAWRVMQAGDVDRIAGVELRILHPPLPEWERQRVRNDDSIVLELRFGDVSIVLPGDIGREPEAALAPRLSLAPLVILKAAHHGSLTSSVPEFVAAVKPAAVVFSAGRQNRFGHPAPAVVARYVAARAEVFRTDEEGAVIVETDGQTVDVRTYRGRTMTFARRH